MTTCAEAQPIGSPRSSSLLLVDDDGVFRERLAKALRARGYEVLTAGDAAEGARIASERRFDHAVVDLRLPGGGGLGVLGEIRKRSLSTRVVVLTGYGNIASAVEAMRLGACSYLAKPADADDLVRALRDDQAPAAHRAPPASHHAPLAQAKREHIERVLADCGGNVSETARRLGVTRRTLQLQLKQLKQEGLRA